MFDSDTPIRRGSIVSCRFPLAEKPGQPGPAARPALILRVFRDRDGVWKAIVAYGTSRSTRANAGHEIRVQGPDRLKATGLHRPTRFTLSRMRILPLDRDFFAYAPSGSPLLGHLDDEALSCLDRLCDTLASYAPELKLLSGGRTTTATPDRADNPGQPGADAVDGRTADLFFLDSFTGRRDLNGLSASTSRPTVEIRKSRRPRHLRRRA